MRFPIQCATGLLALTGTLSANAFTNDTLLVVTDDGLFVPDPTSTTPLVHVPPSAFLPAGVLDRPRVAYDGESGAYVGTRDGLWHVTIDASFAYTVEEVVTLNPIHPLDIAVHPATKQVYVLDEGFYEIALLDPPVTATSIAAVEVPVDTIARAIALDPRSTTTGVLVAEADVIRRYGVDGSLGAVALVDVDSVAYDPQAPSVTS